MRRSGSFLLVLAGLNAWPCVVAHAEDAVPAALPGEEVMHPTERGLTWTPGFSKAFSHAWIRDNLADDMELRPEQEKALSQKIADQVRRMSSDNPKVTQQFFETLVETMIETDGGKKMTPQIAGKIAEAARPIIPLWHDFLDQTVDDAGSVLDAGQQKQFEGIVQRRQRRIDRIDETLQRWSQGDYRKDDKPLNRLFDPGRDDEEQQDDGANEFKVKPEFRQAAQQARRIARYDVDRLGIGEWQRFVSLARSTFKFTSEQSGKADALLAEYKTRAKTVMTPEWKQKVGDNRLQSRLGMYLTGEPSGPWVFHLNQEFDQLAAPIMAFQKELYKKILALATPEQRDAVVNDLAAKAAKHGLTMDDADRAVLIAALK